MNAPFSNFNNSVVRRKMNPLLSSSISLLIPTLVLLHLYYAPYTKVEESFNIQAAHDIITYGIPTKDVQQRLAAEYDHVSFPGSVPRTFVGALVLAGLSRPWVGWLRSPEQLQMLVRGILGLFNSLALLAFGNAVGRVFGDTARVWYMLLQASQFHVIYYASRTLPNMFAFGLSTLALRSLVLTLRDASDSRTVRKRSRLALYLLTIAGILFRSEIAILLATQTLYLLVRGRLSPTSDIIPAGIAAAVIGLLITVPIDSFFWQRFPLWPEWSGFYYNTILGKSADWGTSPWSFYFLNAIPRLLLNPLSWALCIPLSLAPANRQHSLALLTPALAFTAVYSLLPHKEWRFIVYTVPSLTAAAAVGAAHVWTRRAKSPLHRLLSLALAASVLASLAASTALLHVSSLNYPGGEALARLHARAHGEKEVLSVHLDNLACQTGVSRFLERPPPRTLSGDAGRNQTLWVYDKTEGEALLLDPAFWQRFDYVLAERPERAIGMWEVVDTVCGFGGVGVVRPGEEVGGGEGCGDLEQARGTDAAVPLGRRYGTWAMSERLARRTVTRGWWLKLRMEPQIRILRRQKT